MRKLIPLFILAFLVFSSSDSLASEIELSNEEIYEKRMELYNKSEARTGIPWYYIAAIDQFERSIRSVRKDLPDPDHFVGYYLAPEVWSGPLNPNLHDTNPISISLFGGVGIDGDGDGKADQNDGEDLFYFLGQYLSQFGVNDDSFRMALWEYYHRDQNVRSIMANAKIYRTLGRIDLDDRAFPVPKRYNYSYKSTWGDRRGWGGRRIHEGTDIFANHGTPVRSVNYGVVELKGWNKYGGWRIGIRDINNTYHYYAHLGSFEKGIKVGDVLEPGSVVGYVGSTGYGPPGTSGKFPPHLHYGMYKDNGVNEWSFDPYPYLRSWERTGVK